MTPKHKSSDAGKLDMPKRSHKMFPLSKKVSAVKAVLKERERPHPHTFITAYFYNCSIFLLVIVFNLLLHRWQTQGPWTESGPLPCFMWPGTLFLPGSIAELLAPN